MLASSFCVGSDGQSVKNRSDQRATTDLHSIIHVNQFWSNTDREGNFGEVWKAMLDERHHRDAVGSHVYSVAVKTVKGNVMNDQKLMQDLQKEFIREAVISVIISAQFRHPNVVSLVGVVTSGWPYMMVVEMCEQGSL